MPTQRKPTPRKAAYKANGLPTSKVETDRRIPLIVLAVIAAIMAIVLVFTQCSAPAPTQNNIPAVGEPATSQPASSSEEVDAEPIEEPENPSAKASLSEYTWEELSQISEKIAAAANEADAIYVAKQYRLVDSSGKLDGSATKTVEMTDGTTAQVRIIGFNHDTASGTSDKAGITFMFTDAVSSMPYNEDGTNNGGWAASSISYYLGVDFWSQLPEDLTSNIVEVTKAANTGAADSIGETGDIMWLPSYIEITGAIDSTISDMESTLSQEGSQYQLFKDAGVSSAGNNAILVMHKDAQATAWWLRSADVLNENSFCYVNAAGHPSSGAPATQDYLIVPCFCL